MELRHLRYFAAVAELLSFRRAAERLHVSQPTLTRQIQALEAEMDLRLLERDRRREVALTAAGRTFLADAHQVLAVVAAARGRAQAAGRGESERLNCGHHRRLVREFLPGCLRAFRAEFPRVEICLFEMERAEQLAALRERRIHLSLFPCLGALREPGLDSRTVWTCPMVAVLPAGHALAGKGRARHQKMDIQALAGEVLVIPSPEVSPGYVERLDQICRAAGFRPASLRPVDGAENVLGMVAAGYGVAILPQILVAASKPLCVTKPLRAPVAPLELKLLWRRESLTEAMRSFLAVAKRCSEGSHHKTLPPSLPTPQPSSNLGGRRMKSMKTRV